MIVCLCNALTDRQLEQAVAQGARRPREVYAACDCKAQCGTCTRMVLGMIRDAVLQPAAGEATMAAG
ncbi:(2Fe-2S)-binding protein [Siccirubricoccus sp. KC 17139]|uniref:Bacterioferritin-associated ferredoxin n=2 Tax=Siccirubricoccus soli TaxID=2899147 RepID=A0ABT1D0T8_9PROT|nr:(2Fe-2S)-binding protein [Siccirubricoccus soli]MCO6415528.1 (2Fe-2S)-binding protein [Siccirubricoccus soli]MCP2681660.1 (2Fe-2S)-binding protein [Siccirubricoccus soli]